jgi:methylase of polypeptide subunit release factors
MMAPVAAYPIPDKAAARALGTALRTLEYSEDAITDLLGDDAFDAGARDAQVHARRLPETRLATAVRLLFLQLPVATDDAVRALGKRGVAALASTGLAEVGKTEVVPRSRVTAILDVLLASDGFSRDAADPTDYVATYTPTSRLLDLLTPRRRISRALDVGTGPGIHALLAARHSKLAVATDVNPRALAYTELNAALNDLGNVECRAGSLFEPAEGETFDLITCNAPFVVSPERRWTYRDAGYEADDLSALVVDEAARHLAHDGFASLLVSWVAHDEDALDERAVAWVERTGCDAWILPVFESEPLEHAAGWNDHLAGDSEAFSDVLDAWTGYLAELGVERLSEGAIILHRGANGRAPEIRIDEVEEDELDGAGDQVLRAFENRERLAGMRSADLLDEKLAPAMPLRAEVPLPTRSRDHAVVHVDDGTYASVEAAPRAADVIGELDGERTLRKAIRVVAGRFEVPAQTLERQALKLVRELLELGALRFPPTKGSSR